MGYIHPAVSEICDPQCLDPICGKFNMFLAHGQAHMGKMGKRPWQCITRGLDNSTELWVEKIRQAVTELWVPQVWQPTARPPGPWRQYPSSLEGWGVKKCTNLSLLHKGKKHVGSYHIIIVNIFNYMNNNVTKNLKARGLNIALVNKNNLQGVDSIQRWLLTSIGNPTVEIRRSCDRLISTMWFPILVRRHLYIESGPRLL